MQESNQMMALSPNTLRIYAAPSWQQDIIGTPAMIMAYGIFILYAAPYLFQTMLDEFASTVVLQLLAVALCVFAVYVLFRFVMQFFNNRIVLWDYTLDHIRIGTWVAGAGVLASVVMQFNDVLAKTFAVVGWIVWVMYIIWLVKMSYRGMFKGGDLNGSILLTTVATQSIVVTFVRVWPERLPESIFVLVLVNAAGIAFYWMAFALVWVAGGIRGPIARWVPQNNITHGALSITMLAAQMVEVNLPGTLPYFHFVIQAAWVIAALILTSSFAFEIYLIVTERKPLLRFHMTNYSRNFTYGMFFACTYYGYMYPHPSVMKAILGPGSLLVLAGIVLLVNVWELLHQMVTYWRQAPLLQRGTSY